MRQTAAEMTAKTSAAGTRAIHSGASKKSDVGSFTGDQLAPRPVRAGHPAEYRGLAAARCLFRGCGRFDRALRLSARQSPPTARGTRLRGYLSDHAPCVVAWFLADRDPVSRLLLMTTSGTVALHHFAFEGNDTIVLGRESAGVPAAVHDAVTARIVIPLRPTARSLDVALAGAVALGRSVAANRPVPPP